MNKYHNIQNYSFPIAASDSFSNSSINLHVDSDSFPMTWGTFLVILLLIHWLPPGLQLAMRDVADAYHTVPLHRLQWPCPVIRLDDNSFAIDTMLCFGSGPSARMYSTVHNATSDILHFHSIGPISSWVDDHLFFRVRCICIQDYNQRHREWN